MSAIKEAVIHGGAPGGTPYERPWSGGEEGFVRDTMHDQHGNEWVVLGIVIESHEALLATLIPLQDFSVFVQGNLPKSLHVNKLPCLKGFSMRQAAQRLDRLLPRRHPSRAEEFRPAAANYDRDLDVCLRTEAVPAIAEILNRPSFRRLAAHPVVSLAPGAPSEERRLLVQVLGRFLQVVSDIRAAMAAATQNPNPVLIEEFERRLASIEADADGENVSVNDYFRPLFRTRDCSGAESVQRGELVVAYQPLLNHVGNIIARNMMVRLHSMLGALQRLALSIEESFECCLPTTTPPSWTASLAELRAQVNHLEHLTLTSTNARQVEAAITLVQVIAGLSTTDLDLSWLEVDSDVLEWQRGILWHRLRGNRGVATTARIFDAMQRVAAYIEVQPPAEQEVETAVAEGKLVIHVGRREVYWEGNSIHGGLTPQSFQMLVQLARRRRDYCTMRNLGFPDKSRQAAYSAINRLRTDVPATLSVRIERGGEARTEPCYRLCLGHSELLLV